MNNEAIVKRIEVLEERVELLIGRVVSLEQTMPTKYVPNNYPRPDKQEIDWDKIESWDDLGITWPCRVKLNKKKEARFFARLRAAADAIKYKGNDDRMLP